MNVITNNPEKSKHAILALQTVNDPEIGLNIVDLGLVYQLDFDLAGKKIYSRMTLTTQFCPMGATILDAARQALQAAFPGEAVEIILTFEPRWDTGMISPYGKEFLNK